MTPESIFVEKRKSERLEIKTDISLTLGEKMVEGILFDISSSGAKVQLDSTSSSELNPSSENVVLNISKFGDFDGNIVWNDGQYVGIQFSENHKALVSLIRDMAGMNAATAWG